jgi:NADH-quinone oxidoreductase subunit G
MPKLKINGIEIEVEDGTSILQAAEQLGIEIPRFCYHDRLSVPANCRMCLVEVKGGPPKPQASCALACAEGMEVETESEMIHKARKSVMEMLLINHPLDCPICDQGGECDLQDQAMAYGYDRSRYQENKRAVKDKELGPLIKTVMTRCIQCTRCVRFGEEIAGTTELGYLHRGEEAEIGTFIEKAVSTELSGNLIDICPVGALTSKPYAFNARPWELSKTDSIDVHDALGSNIRIDSRGNEVLRILPRLNENINEEWINDRTRFSYDGLNNNRIDRPYIRNSSSGKLEECSWDNAFHVLSEKLKSTSSDKISALAGDLSDLESIVALKDLMVKFQVKNFECRIDGTVYDISNRADYVFNSTIKGVEGADVILLIGTNPRHEASLINARIRKTWLSNNIKIGLIGEEVDLTYPYEYLGKGPEALEKLMNSKSGFSKTILNANSPLMIIGSGAFNREDGAEIYNLAREACQKLKIVTKDHNGFNFLHNVASRVGALDVGFYSKHKFDLKNMDFVYSLGASNEMISSHIHENAFVVYQGTHGCELAERADVILPGAAYTEKDALYVNTEGRMQTTRRAVYPPGEAKEDWKIIRALSDTLDMTLEYNDLHSLRARIAAEWDCLDELHSIKVSDLGKVNKPKSYKNLEFKNIIDDFYLTNDICIASSTMKECSQKFSTKKMDLNKEAA